MSLGRGPRRSRRVHRLRVVAFVIALLGVTSGTAWAQGGTGTISGRVFDAESGAPIEGATVILAYPEQADGSDAPQQVVVTGIEGDYEFGAVPAGFYGLSFIKSGYRASNVTNVQVVSGKDAVTNFPLPPAQALAGGDGMELEAYTVEASVDRERWTTVVDRSANTTPATPEGLEDRFAATPHVIGDGGGNIVLERKQAEMA